ncbi:MAG: hypothetical protein M4D85_08050 [Actinomycetota bacterium]|nr:hypothetical protein [Actinomycetota bacterium]
MSTSTTDPPAETDDGRARRLRGAVLLLGAAAIAGLVEGGILDYYTFPLLLGLVYLAAAAISRSHRTLWGPGLVTTAVGLAVALWFGAGRGGDSFQLLALTVMALGLGGVLAAALGKLRGLVITPMSIALPVLLFGAFSLLEQQRVEPVTGSTWVYVALLALWGAFELRPARR